MAKYEVQDGAYHSKWGKQIVFKDGQVIGEFPTNEDAHRFITPLLQKGDVVSIPEECSRTLRTATMHAQKNRARLEKLQQSQRQEA